MASKLIKAAADKAMVYKSYTKDINFSLLHQEFNTVSHEFNKEIYGKLITTADTPEVGTKVAHYTVKFLSPTTSGIPRFEIGIDIRTPLGWKQANPDTKFTAIIFDKITAIIDKQDKTQKSDDQLTKEQYNTQRIAALDKLKVLGLTSGDLSVLGIGKN